jgi:hypothetical protein
LGEEIKERDNGDDLTNVQCKPIWNCHNEFSLYNEYILIKMKKNQNIKLPIASAKSWWMLEHKCPNWYKIPNRHIIVPPLQEIAHLTR